MPLTNLLDKRDRLLADLDDTQREIALHETTEAEVQPEPLLSLAERKMLLEDPEITAEI